MSNKLTLNDFINRSKNIHGNKFMYSDIDYINMTTKVNIFCNACKEYFNQTPKNHMKGRGCPYCSGRKINKDKTINKLKSKNNGKYNYGKIKRTKNNRLSIDVECMKHGWFTQMLYLHKKGHGCPKCNGGKDNKLDFIKKSKLIHGTKYEYSLVKYKNSHTKVNILCKYHGLFRQTPNKHILGQGCPVCNESKGEIKIEKYLLNNKIDYIKQKTFENCKYVSNLKFDFYLPKYNTLIEYDGEQHFIKYRFEKNDNNLLLRKSRDNIKNIYCKENNINLIRIKYDEDINSSLDKNLIKIPCQRR